MAALLDKVREARQIYGHNGLMVIESVGMVGMVGVDCRTALQLDGVARKQVNNVRSHG